MPIPSPASRVLLIGWDAADWKMIDPMIQAGELPALAKFTSEGVRGNLATLLPTLSPILWTSIATGKTADKHGILGFIEPNDDSTGFRLSSSASRRVKAIWNILSQSDKRSLVVNWYASHPAEPVKGVVVSNLFQEGVRSADGAWPMADGSVNPASLREIVADLRLHPDELTPADLALFLPHIDRLSAADPRIETLRRQVAQCSSVHNVATALLETEAWDFAAVFYDLIDVAGHHFMQFHPPRMAHVSDSDFQAFSHVMRGVYRFHDLMLDRLMQIVGDDTTVIIVSDHGFYSDHLRPQGTGMTEHAAADAAWHRPLGIVAMRGPCIKQGEHVYGANLVDLAPTVLAMLGVAVGADMDGRVLVEGFRDPPHFERVFSWETTEGDAGQHPANMRQDPFDVTQAMSQLAALGYVQEPSADFERSAKAGADDAQFNLAVVYLTTRRPREALPILRRLFEADPGVHRYAINLAQCCSDVGMASEARAILEPIVRTNRSASDARLMLAAALASDQRADEAAAVLLAEGAPSDHSSMAMLGGVYIAMRRWSDAQRMFEAIIGADPDNARAHHGLAMALLYQERFDDAAESALRAVHLLHFYPDAHHTLGVALTWMRDYPHAIQSFQVAISMHPGLLDSHRYLASIYRLLGDTTHAREHRDIAESLVKNRAANQGTVAELSREAPMGPREWARHAGSDAAEHERPME